MRLSIRYVLSLSVLTVACSAGPSVDASSAPVVEGAFRTEPVAIYQTTVALEHGSPLALSGNDKALVVGDSRAGVISELKPVFAKDGSVTVAPPLVLHRHSGPLSFVDLRVDDTGAPFVYWYDGIEDAFWRATLGVADSGVRVQSFKEASLSPVAPLRTDANYIYFHGYDVDTRSWAIRRIAKGGSPSVEIVVAAGSDMTISDFVVRGRDLYVAESPGFYSPTDRTQLFPKLIHFDLETKATTRADIIPHGLFPQSLVLDPRGESILMAGIRGDSSFGPDPIAEVGSIPISTAAAHTLGAYARSHGLALGSVTRTRIAASPSVIYWSTLTEGTAGDLSLFALSRSTESLTRLKSWPAPMIEVGNGRFSQTNIVISATQVYAHPVAISLALNRPQPFMVRREIVQDAEKGDAPLTRYSVVTNSTTSGSGSP